MRRSSRDLLAAILAASSLLAPSPASADSLEPGDLVVGALLSDGNLPFPNISIAVLQIDPATDDREIFSGSDLSGNMTGTGPPFPLIVFPDVKPLAVERDGSVVVSVGTALYRLDPATGDRTVVSSAGVGSGPLGSLGRVAVDSDGSILAASSGLFTGTCIDGDALLRVDPTTGDRTIASGCGVGSGTAFTGLLDVAVEPSGDVLVADGIFDIPPATKLVRVDETTGDRATLASGVSFDPGQVAVRADGTILVTEVNSTELYAVDPTTGDTTLYSGAALGSGTGFGFAFGLEVSPDGSALVSDSTAIYRVDPATRDRTVLAGPPPIAAEAPFGFFEDLVEIPPPPPTPALGPRLLAAAALLLGVAGIAITRARRAGKE